MRDPTEGVSFSEMRMPFLKRNLPGKLDEDEEYDRFYRRLQHYDGLVIRICANNYTILYQPPTHDWFWRSNAPVPDKDVDGETAQSQIQNRGEEQRQEQIALKEKRHDRFVEKFVNNPNWARGLSKDKVDESNQRFRSWLNGTLKESPIPSGPAEAAGEGEGQTQTEGGGEGKVENEVDVQGDNTTIGASAHPETETDTTTENAPAPAPAPGSTNAPEEKEEEKKEDAKVEPTDTEMADAEPVNADNSTAASTSVPAPEHQPEPEPEPGV